MTAAKAPTISLIAVLTLLLSAAESVAGSPRLISIRVSIVDRTSNSAVNTDADVLTVNECPAWKDSCHKLGVFVPSKTDPVEVQCPMGYDIYAHLHGANYYDTSTHETCAKTADVIQLKATRFNDSSWMVVVGDGAFKVGDYRKATIFFSAANSVKPSQDTYEKSLVSLGLALGVPDKVAVGYDPTQGRREATPALKAAVQEFQIVNDLPANGFAGGATIAKFAPGGDVYRLIVQSAASASN